MNDAKPQSTLFSTVIWLVLVLLTIATYCIGETGMTGRGVMLTLLVITMIKSQMVANYFMELRHTRLLWRGIMFSYFIIVGSLIAAAYVMASK
jgi:cytochrome c oxidase subunit IV